VYKKDLTQVYKNKNHSSELGVVFLIDRVRISPLRSEILSKVKLTQIKRNKKST